MSETKITKMVVQKEGRKLIFNPAGDIDMSQYYTKSEIDSKFNSYALKTEIPDTSSLATKTELNSVKSTATTANNTANSAKTTAQNALNTANNNKFGTVYSKFAPGSGNSVVLTDNLFLKTDSPWISMYALTIDGFKINPIDYYAGESRTNSIIYGLAAKGKTLTQVGGNFDGRYMLGEYLH